MNVFFPGPAGRLEGALWTPEGGSPRAVAAFAHPHPLHGGTMRNNVVYRAARGLQQAGLAVLRFNFRGVGLSEGRHDGNGAEDGDLSSALDHLAQRFPDLPLWAGGFSFGSRTAIRVAVAQARVERVVLVAPPVRAYPCEELAHLARPGLIVSAGRDEYGTGAELAARFPDLDPDLERVEVPDVDHFFTGALPELQELVRAWAARTLDSVPK